MWFCRLALVLALLISVLAEDNKKSDKSDLKRSFNKDCDKSYSATCLKLDMVNFVDRLSQNENISVFPGVSIVRENASARANNVEVAAEIAREFPNDPEARLDAFLLNKVQNFLKTRSIKLNLGEQDDDNAVTARKRKRGGGMNMIFAAAAMMKSTYFALAMGALAALAGKALMTGLISLLLSAIIGLKSLTSGGEKTTYEVVSKPIYTHSSSHSSGHEDYHHGGHGRSFEPLPLGLRPEYKPA